MLKYWQISGDGCTSYSLDFPVQVPACFLKVLNSLQWILQAVSRNVLYSIPKVKTKLPGLYDIDCLVTRALSIV